MATGNLITCITYPNLLFLFFATLFPIWIWLEFLLNEDPEPEPRSLIAFSIFLGFLSSILSYYGEFYLYKLTGEMNLAYYFGSAFIEEFFKFLVIFLFIFPTRYFDEPVDAMIYMGFSALGFSFIETYLNLCKSIISEASYGLLLPIVVVTISVLRFFGANFLHLLASTIIGFGYAISIKTRRVFPFVISFLASGVLHFLYNIFIIKDDIRFYIFPILWAVFFLVLIQFKIIKIKEE